MLHTGPLTFLTVAKYFTYIWLENLFLLSTRRFSCFFYCCHSRTKCDFFSRVLKGRNGVNTTEAETDYYSEMNILHDFWLRLSLAHSSPPATAPFCSASLCFAFLHNTATTFATLISHVIFKNYCSLGCDLLVFFHAAKLVSFPALALTFGADIMRPSLVWIWEQRFWKAPDGDILYGSWWCNMFLLASICNTDLPNMFFLLCSHTDQAKFWRTM